MRWVKIKKDDITLTVFYIYRTFAFDKNMLKKVASTGSATGH